MPAVSVYKPHSEGDGNLVVLMSSDSPDYPQIGLVDSEGNLIDRGRYVGRTNGGRPTYRFSRPGHAHRGTVSVIAGRDVYPIGNPGLRDENVAPGQLAQGAAAPQREAGQATGYVQPELAEPPQPISPVVSALGNLKFAQRFGTTALQVGQGIANHGLGTTVSAMSSGVPASSLAHSAGGIGANPATNYIPSSGGGAGFNFAGAGIAAAMIAAAMHSRKSDGRKEQAVGERFQNLLATNPQRDELAEGYQYFPGQDRSYLVTDRAGMGRGLEALGYAPGSAGRLFQDEIYRPAGSTEPATQAGINGLSIFEWQNPSDKEALRNHLTDTAIPLREWVASAPKFQLNDAGQEQAQKWVNANPAPVKSNFMTVVNNKSGNLLTIRQGDPIPRGYSAGAAKAPIKQSSVRVTQGQQ